MAVILDEAELDAITRDASTADAGGGEGDAPTRGRSASSARPRRDRKPGNASKRRTSTSGRASASERASSETRAIGEALGQLLAMPGFAFGMVGEDYLAAHFTQTGPAFGMQIAAASETNPMLRAWLRRLQGGDTMAMLVLGAVAYAVPPLVYVLTPNTSPLRRTFSVPPRAGRPEPPPPDPGFVEDFERAGDEYLSDADAT